MSGVSHPPLYDGAVKARHVADNSLTTQQIDNNQIRLIVAATAPGAQGSSGLFKSTSASYAIPYGGTFSGSVIGKAGTWVSLGSYGQGITYFGDERIDYTLFAMRMW